jgi:MtrB/PioB family decaheme-associated outer membrane protein
MRNRVMTVTAALLLASASFAMAQDQPKTPAQPQAPAATAPAAPGLNMIDFGYRGTSSNGDEARFERYRDTRDGAYTNIVLEKETDNYLFKGSAKNIGYNDQNYTANYQNKAVRFGFLFDAIPLNYCYNCSTPWVESSGNVWTLDPATRLQVQKSRYPAPVVPLPAGYTSIPTTAAQAQLTSVYRGLAKPFDIQQRRDTTGFNLAYDVNTDVAITGGFKSTHKTGNQPFGMSFAFNNANELPMHLDNRANDLSIGVEWVKPQGMFRAAYDYSAFSNKYNEIMWDNPLQAVDYTNGLAPVLGPYDPNGYSNGNGPARGRISAFPDSTMSVVSFMGMYKVARRTTLNGTIQIIDQAQDDDLIPWTSNAIINQPLVWASFPEIAALPRPTAEAKVRSVNALLNFTTRMNNKVGLNAKYRHNTHANLTRPFEAVEYVRFDAVPEEIGGTAEGHDIVRDTFDTYLSFTAMPFSTFRVGYGYDNYNRTGRAHNDMRDQAFRLTWDTTGSQYLSLRAGYERVARKGFGFSEMAIEEGGAQPGLRFYDEANRDRDRVNLIATFMPADKIDITATVTYTKDVYGGPGMEFGLLDNKSNAYSIGVGFMPTTTMDFGASYGRDNYTALQKSRNASPPPDPTWTDPTRDWTMDNEETVNNFDLYFNLNRALKNTDIAVNYTFSDSDNAFTFGGPRIASLTAAGTFEQHPNVTNSFKQLRADLKYFFSPKVGVGFGWWYEKFGVTDFATVDLPGQPGTPRIDYLGEISTGYGNRPYDGNTVSIRLLYTF